MKLPTIILIFAIGFKSVYCGGPGIQINDSLKTEECLEIGEEKVSVNGIWSVSLTSNELLVTNKKTLEKSVKVSARKVPFYRGCVDEYGNFFISSEDGNSIVRFEQYKEGGNLRITNDGLLVLEKDGFINLSI